MLRRLSYCLIAALVLTFVLMSASVGAFDLDSLLTKSVGGEVARERLRTSGSMQITGIVTMGPMTGVAAISTELPNKFRLETDFDAFKVVQAFDGETAWQADPNGSITRVTGFERSTLLAQAYFATYSYLFEDRLPGEIWYAGIDSVDGLPYHRVEFCIGGNDTVSSWYDPATGHLRHDRIYIDNTTSFSTYLEYREYEGVDIATSITSISQEAGIKVQVEVMTVNFDPSLDPAIFEMPLSGADFRFPEGVTEVAVPIEYRNGHIFLEARVNGRRFRFLLDSGASANYYNRFAVAGLDLKTVGEVPAKGIGGYETTDLVRIDSLQVGELWLGSQVGGSQDLRQLAPVSDDYLVFGGVLGYGFMSHFPILIDFEGGIMTIYDPEHFDPKPGGHEVNFDLTYQIPTIEATLNGISGQYIVDLGNAIGLIVHPEFARRSKLGWNESQEAKSLHGVGDEVDSRSATVKTLSIGDIDLSEVRVILPDSSGGLSGSRELAGNIGNPVLERFRVLFDYRGHRLLFYD